MNYENRLGRAREEMRKRNIGMMFLTYGANLWYLAGVHRLEPRLTDNNSYGDYACGAYIGSDSGLTLVVPRMGRAFFQREVVNKPWINEVRVIDESERPGDVLAEAVKSFRLKERGVSLDDRTWMKSGLLFQQILSGNPISVASDIIAPMRMIKDADEIAIMQKAGELTDEVYGEVLKFLKVGVTEYDVAHEISYQFAKRGVEYSSFMPAVRFTKPGLPREIGALGSSTDPSKKLERGDAITFDFGACYRGYCSDFGRTVFVDEPPAEFLRIHHVVMEAQAVAIEAMVSGTITAMQLDSKARNIIEEAGYGGEFTHRLGHGIGVTVHEPPYLYEPDETVLVSGMTFTIEPSIYLPNNYGCRVEDVVMVTEKGGLPFSNFHKRLSII